MGNDHHPFGMLLVDRTWQPITTYKYGFNGQEQDDEIYGNGNLNTADFWEYDTRLGRRWNLDLIKKYWESSYAAFTNNPIYFIDPAGLVGEPNGGGPKKKTGLDYRGQENDFWSEEIGSRGNINAPINHGKENVQFSGPENPAEPKQEVMKILVTAAVNYSNDELLTIMGKPFEKIKNGARVMNRWKENTGETLDTYADRSEFAGSGVYLRLEQNIKNQIASEYKLGKPIDKWDISDGLFAPNFGTTVVSNLDAATVLGNTIQVVVVLHSFKVIYDYNSQGETFFSADVEIIVSDWFGVSEDDVIGDGFLPYDIANIFGGKGLLAMWILQHQRGYKPFINRYHINTKITGKI